MFCDEFIAKDVRVFRLPTLPSHLDPFTAILEILNHACASVFLGLQAMTPTSPSSSTSAKPKKPQALKLLSFADSEENENPCPRSAKAHRSATVKPSSLSSSSNKIKTLKDQIAHSSSSSVPSNVEPQDGTYTKEDLRELQKNTRTLVTPSSSRPNPKPLFEPIIVLKGLVKGNAAKRPSRDSFCPDQETIQAKRERLRLAHPVAPDYISLNCGSNHSAAKGLSDKELEFCGRIVMSREKVDGGRKGFFEEVEKTCMWNNVKKYWDDFAFLIKYFGD
ncbi:hypothetical protein Fmac_023700 [Flemingia macrophylla]|uniref:Uncharacterized protein n=1 Tax=Flemingia macrophylla TaxID=520843 RepID=A0ABD1LM97_9FABA